MVCLETWSAVPVFDMRSYQREWIAKRRREWFAANGPCVRCGSSECLELDHRDSSSKVSHKIWSWSKTRREAEIAKCQVLCRACHAARHAAERTRHGMSRYRNGCRCEVCRTAKRLKRRRERDNQLERQFVSSPTTQYGLTGPSLIERQREMRERLGK